MKNPAELSFEDTCKLELKVKEQEAIIKTLREESMYWRLLVKEICDNMDRKLTEEYKNEPRIKRKQDI